MDILSYKLGQKSGGGSGTTDYSQLTNKPSINDVELSGNKTASDLGLQDELVSGTNIKSINNNSLLGSGNIDIESGQVIQYTEVPTASADTVGEIIQYTGITDSTYTNGYFYECVSDGQNPATYSWVVKQVNPATDLSNYLAKNNTTSYTPTADYNPATKKYVDGAIAGAGGLDENAVRTLINNAGVVEVNANVVNTLKTYYNVNKVKVAHLIDYYKGGIFKLKDETGVDIYYNNNNNSRIADREGHIMIAPASTKIIISLWQYNGGKISLAYDETNNSFTTNTNYTNYHNFDENYNVPIVMENLKGILGGSNGTEKLLTNKSAFSITGAYTFNTLPQSSVVPTTNTHLVNKAYVDGLLSTYTGYDATKTQALKNVNGTFTWVDEA